MTRKHFDLIAAALHNSRPLANNEEYLQGYPQWTRDCEALAEMCAKNKNFDKWRFLTACGQSWMTNSGF